MTALRYRIGPLTTYEDVNTFERLFRQAKPGDLVPYAWGPALGRDAFLKRRTRELHEAGAGRLFTVKGDQGCTYVIEKLAVRASDLPQDEPCIQSIADRPEGRLLAVLEQLDGAPMPSLELLAENAGLPHRQAADYRLRLLIEGGYVRVRREGVRRFADILKTEAAR